MIKVYPAYPGEPLEAMLARFNQKCKREGILKDMKRGLAYIKPSDAKRGKSRKTKPASK